MGFRWYARCRYVPAKPPPAIERDFTWPVVVSLDDHGVVHGTIPHEWAGPGLDSHLRMPAGRICEPFNIHRIPRLNVAARDGTLLRDRCNATIR